MLSGMNGLYPCQHRQLDPSDDSLMCAKCRRDGARARLFYFTLGLIAVLAALWRRFGRI